MKCDNKICVYQENGKCKNNDIEIDWHGLCKNIVPIRLTQKDLELNKSYTKMMCENDEEYYFNKETGEVTLKNEISDKYDLTVKF